MSNELDRLMEGLWRHGEVQNVLSHCDLMLSAAAEITALERQRDELLEALKDARAFMQFVMEGRGDCGVSILIKQADSAIASVEKPNPIASGGEDG